MNRVTPSAVLRAAAPRRRYGRAASLAAPLLVAAVVTASAPGLLHIRIRPGDTLTAIAERYHTTVAALIALNHLPGNGNLIYAGAELLVPAATGRPAAAAPDGASRATRYTVRPGDSLDAIAARFHVDPAVIARRNHLPPSLIVRLGQTLVIPRAGATREARRRPATAARSDPAAVRAVIARTARAYGVAPTLAEAVAWEESGFNQSAISRTGAVGVMQIEPYTDRYVARYVVGRPLNPTVLQDNVTVGVALLAELLRATGSVPRAVAGYYQGLGSIRERGLLPVTRQYVADVLALRQRLREQ